MPKVASWDVEQTWDCLELFSESFGCSCGTTPPTSLYFEILKKLNDKYGKDSYELEILQSKYQRMKADYKTYSVLINNSSLSWDKETRTVNCLDEHLENYKKVILFLYC